jgi:hypothetical protein
MESELYDAADAGRTAERAEAVVVVGAIAGAWLLLGHVAAVIVAFAVVALGLTRYERAYAAAARRARERLA